MALNEAGDSFGSYKLLSPLGEGGMGVVYVAEHQALGKRVALKVLRPELADEEMSARFVAEARAAAQIGHEHIVEVTDFGQSSAGRFFFVMELLEGQSLAELIAREGPLALRRALKIAAEVAGALAASHAAGIVHRDLKPDNVFLIRRGGDRDYVKVLDFGLAKPVQASQDRLHQTKTGSTLGTPYYMAPEQWLSKDIDGRTDVYALGVLLYQMVTGQLPFRGESWGELCLAHTTSPFPSAVEQRADVPASLESALARATQKAMGDRHDSVTELASALAQVAAELDAEQPVTQQASSQADTPRYADPESVDKSDPLEQVAATSATEAALAATEPMIPSEPRVADEPLVPDEPGEVLATTLVSETDATLMEPQAAVSNTRSGAMVALIVVGLAAAVAALIGLSADADPPASAVTATAEPSTGQATSRPKTAVATSATATSSNSDAPATASAPTRSSTTTRKPAKWPRQKQKDDKDWHTPH